MILKVIRSRYKFVVIYILYGGCIQTSVSIIHNPKKSRPNAACEVFVSGSVVCIE
jgi:hypothetical protein